MPILVIGSSNTDMVVQCERLPAPGETVLGGQFLMNPGGKGANQVVAAARLSPQAATTGVPRSDASATTFVASVGNDLFGREAVAGFKREGIDTRYVVTSADQPSGVALINVDKRGENCITVAPGANAHLRPADVADALAQAPPDTLVLLQLEIPLDTVRYVVTEAHRLGRRVLLNPAPAQPLPADVVACLYLITPNETEAALLTGQPVTDVATATAAARALRAMGAANVVITLGARGALLLTADGTVTEVPAPPVGNVVDTTAAGDCFNGALAVALTEGRSLPQAVAFACRAASVSVTRLGAQASMPYRHELEPLTT